MSKAVPGDAEIDAAVLKFAQDWQVASNKLIEWLASGAIRRNLGRDTLTMLRQAATDASLAQAYIHEAYDLWMPVRMDQGVKSQLNKRVG